MTTGIYWLNISLWNKCQYSVGFLETLANLTVSIYQLGPGVEETEITIHWLLKELEMISLTKPESQGFETSLPWSYEIDYISLWKIRSWFWPTMLYKII